MAPSRGQRSTLWRQETDDRTSSSSQKVRSGRGRASGFCALPGRAIGMPELTATDFRVLAAIAAKDMMGATGKHCFASHRELAKMTVCNETSLSLSIKKLLDLGLIKRSPNPKDRRKWIYAVIYDAALDRAAMGFNLEDKGSAKNVCLESGDPLSIGKEATDLKARKGEENHSLAGDAKDLNISSRENNEERKRASSNKDEDPHAIHHNRLAELLGMNDVAMGWQRLQALEDAGGLRRLSLLLANGMLSEEDIISGRNQAAKHLEAKKAGWTNE